MCGGTRAEFLCRPSEDGLSPRVRGNRRFLATSLSPLGSIPACAGEPPPAGAAARSSRVYPRVCGGTMLVGTVAKLRRGLSPRVRGNRPFTITTGASTGSIPACAGEPRSAGRQCQRPRVYPRVCGGTVCSAGASSMWKGLSPRVRGNRRCSRRTSGCLGSIPACAGEPGFWRHRNADGTVYPRVCGGTSNRSTIDRAAAGLSPRVRGNRRGGVLHAANQGSIPACAGEPGPRRWCHSTPAVYPRVCGGTLSSGVVT